MTIAVVLLAVAVVLLGIANFTAIRMIRTLREQAVSDRDVAYVHYDMIRAVFGCQTRQMKSEIAHRQSR